MSVPIRWLAILLLLLFTSGCTLFGSSPSSRNDRARFTFDLEGYVLHEQQGVPGAKVTLSELSISTDTDKNGFYRLSQIRSSHPTATVVASKNGYHGAKVSLEPTDGEKYTVNLYFTVDNRQGPQPRTFMRKVTGRVDYDAPTFPALQSTYLQNTNQRSFLTSSFQSGDFPEAESVAVTFHRFDEKTVEKVAAEVEASEMNVYPRLESAVFYPPAGMHLDAFLDRVAGHPDVFRAELNGVAVPLAQQTFAIFPNDPEWRHNRALHQMIYLPQAWSVVQAGQAVTVAVVDTGVRPDHPDLAPNITQGYDLIERDDDPTDPGPNRGSSQDPGNSHGTHVAGIVGAAANNRIGTAGVAWNVRIMPIRVIDSGTNKATLSDIADGINKAVEMGADIINMSFGGSSSLSMLDQALSDAYRAGVILIAASGNDGINQVLYPAKHPDVIAVGSAGPTGTRSTFTNTGPQLELLAPGESILSTDYDYKERRPVYTVSRGTSMAAPHVAGVAALMLMNGIPADQVREILQATAIKGPSQWNDHDLQRGYGLVNAYAAVTQARLNHASLIVVDGSGNSVTYTTSPMADRTFQFESVIEGDDLRLAGWIDVTGNGRLEAGDYTALIPISSGSGDVDLYVPFQIHGLQDETTQAEIEWALRELVL